MSRQSLFRAVERRQPRAHTRAKLQLIAANDDMATHAGLVATKTQDPAAQSESIFTLPKSGEEGR